MPHGQPDFGAQAVKETVSSLADMGELAARLGSIVTFDRRGDVVWYDDFEGHISKWKSNVSGTDAAATISAEAARNGDFSAKLTTGDVIDKYAEIWHFLPYPIVSKVGFEFSFTLNDNLSELQALQNLYDGSHHHKAGLRYLPATNKLQYFSKTEGWQDLATDLDLYSASYIFHTSKLVIDLSTRKYVRAIFDNVEYDLSTLSYYYVGQITTPYWRQFISAITGVNSNQSIFIDDAIVTQNEP